MCRTLALLVALTATTAANAAITVYTTAGSFNTATSGGSITTQNFDAVPTGGPPINAGGFTITGGYSVNNSSALFGSGRSIQWSTSNPNSVVFTFGSPITAFAADFFDLGTVGATTLNVLLNNGAGNADLVNGFTGGSGNNQFRGFVSTIPFTTITFTNTANGDFVEIDNARFGQANPVPEPISLVVFGGLIVGGAGIALRRRMTAKAMA